MNVPTAATKVTAAIANLALQVEMLEAAHQRLARAKVAEERATWKSSVDRDGAHGMEAVFAAEDDAYLVVRSARMGFDDALGEVIRLTGANALEAYKPASEFFWAESATQRSALTVPTDDDEATS